MVCTVCTACVSNWSLGNYCLRSAKIWKRNDLARVASCTGNPDLKCTPPIPWEIISISGVCIPPATDPLNVEIAPDADPIAPVISNFKGNEMHQQDAQAHKHHPKINLSGHLGTEHELRERGSCHTIKTNWPAHRGAQHTQISPTSTTSTTLVSSPNPIPSTTALQPISRRSLDNLYFRWPIFYIRSKLE